MSLAEIAIVAGGVGSLGVAVGHTLFGRVLAWGDDLAGLAPGNRVVLFTVHVALTLLFVVFGVVSLRHPAELASGRGLGATLSVAYAAFWAWRAVWQLLWFAPLTRRSRRWRRAQPVLVAVFGVLVAAYATPLVVALTARP